MQRMFQKLAWSSIQFVRHAEKNFVLVLQSHNQRHKVLIDPKLTNSKPCIPRRASDGYRLEPMLSQRLVPAAASPVPTAPRRLVRAEPLWQVSASVVSPCGGVQSDWRGKIYTR